MSESTITVRYFAKFRDLAGTAEESVTTTAQTTAELFAELGNRLGIEEPVAHCKVAINDELVDWQAAVESGDVILLFPPVAGG